MTIQNETTQDNYSTVQTTGGNVADVTSTGDTAKVELDRAVAEGVFPATTGAASGKSVNQLTSDASDIPDQATLNTLTKFIMDRDPGEYADPENHNHALFLAADLMRNFSVATKAQQ